MERKKEKAVSWEKAVWSKLSTFWCRKDGVIEHIGEGEGGGRSLIFGGNQERH